jgi:hypothetical protein
MTKSRAERQEQHDAGALVGMIVAAPPVGQ